MPLFRPSALLAGLLCACLVAPDIPAAELPSGEKPHAPGVQRERVNLILIDVVVTDRKGNRVDDLRPEEFCLRVDGHPHPIESVELQRVEAVPAGSTSQRVGADNRPVGTAPIFLASFTRHFVFMFDALNSERGLGSGAIQAARRFLQRGLPPGDEVNGGRPRSGAKDLSGVHRRSSEDARRAENRRIGSTDEDGWREPSSPEHPRAQRRQGSLCRLFADDDAHRCAAGGGLRRPGGPVANPPLPRRAAPS